MAKKTTSSSGSAPGGSSTPGWCVAEAKRAGLRLDYACAMLMKESDGGQQRVRPRPDDLRRRRHQVTKAKYLEYKRRRVASGNKLMQGVGPTQLT